MGQEVDSHVHTRVFLEVLFVRIEFLAALHKDRLAIQIINILVVVATEFLVYCLVEVGQIVRFHVLAIVFHQCSQHLFVECGIPLFAVIFQYAILFLGFVGRSLHLNMT